MAAAGPEPGPLDSPGRADAPRRLTLTEALVPVVTLAVLILASVLLFGDGGFAGPIQIALVLAGLAAVAVASRAGHTSQQINAAAVASIGSGINAMLILFAVGALIGAWAIGGTLVAMVYYGLLYLDASHFPLSSFLICAAVSACLGSSWTTAGTIGVGLMGMAANMEVNPAVIAGAVVAGAYLGETVSPLSDTVNLVSGAAGVPLYAHLKEVALPAVLGLVLSAGFFWLLGTPAEPLLADEIAAIEANFAMSPWLFLPLAVVLALALLRAPAFTSIMVGALVGLGVAVAFAPDRVAAFGDPAGDLPRWIAIFKGGWLVLASGYVSQIGHPTLDTLMSRGGMDSMLLAMWLVIAALGFGGVADRAGVLSRLIDPMVDRVRTARGLVAALAGTGVAANAITADQYLALVLPARMFRDTVTRLGYSPLLVTRTIAASATPTSALVPWNGCGAFMAATLGVSTLAYLPFAVFNLIAPLTVILLATAGIRMLRLPPTEAAGIAP